ncbi:MAG TPA: acyltransferase, partial [Flavobacteriales bacterium]|nr:acyltransferase [Flavobacteriales bacterium]
MISQKSRVFGLDVMRALAIVLVVLVHSDYMLWEHWPGFPWLPFVDGVDLFFVLSGYLVGGILLRYATSAAPSPRRLLDFCQRRWLRTLPNYYLFLVINIVLLSFGLTRGMLNHSALYYFAFLQNLYKPVDTFFWESWSLVIEEWFYLLFPILLFGLMWLLRVAA